MRPPRCPRCGFSFAWNGRTCGHCPTPERVRQLWEQTSRFTELVNSGKRIGPRELLLIAVACLQRVRNLLPDHARAVVDELDAGLEPDGSWGLAAPAARLPHASDPGQEVTNAVTM